MALGDLVDLDLTHQPLLEEAALGTTWDAEASEVGGLPARTLVEVVVFEPSDGRQMLCDLQALDAMPQRPLIVVGRLTAPPTPAASDGEGSGGGGGEGGGECGGESSGGGEGAAPARGPLVRLMPSEWSVEYDHLQASVWVSTATADYRLLSPSVEYEPLWTLLVRRTALAARAIALLLEDGSLSFKQLLRHVVGLNKSVEEGGPPPLKLRAEELVAHGLFVADQISNTEGLEGCSALAGLRQELEQRRKREAREAEGGGNGNGLHGEGEEGEGEGAQDPHKRQRRAPQQFVFDEPDAKRRRQSAGRGRGGGRGEKDASGEPDKPQSALAYYTKAVREAVAAEAGEGAPSSKGPSSQVAKLVSERWKGAPQEERRRYERVARADRERYEIEMQAIQERKAAMAAARPGRKSVSPAKPELSPRAVSRDVSMDMSMEEPAANGAGDGEDEGRAADQSSEAAAGSPAAEGGGGGGGSGKRLSFPISFPMEDAKLIEKEADYRAYLVAASRSLPPPEPAPGVAPPPASFVYPPTLRGPPPARLPPLPDLPQPQPLRLSVGLPYAACTRLLMLWDLSARLGPALRLRLRSLPLAALANAVRCAGALDYSLAAELHCAMLKAVAQDYEGLDEWGAWVRAVQSPRLPLTWPALTAQLIDVSDDFSVYCERRDEVSAALAKGEYSDLTPCQRVEVLAWLADRALQSERLRDHLDRRAEFAAAKRRDRAALVEQEDKAAAALHSARFRLQELLGKMIGSASSRGRPRAAAAKEGKESEAEMRATIDEHEAAVAKYRRLKLDTDEILDNVALRADLLGTDRHGRTYRQLGGRSSGSLLVQSPVSLAGSAASWEALSGPRALAQLVCALHPDGVREGPLRQSVLRVARPLEEVPLEEGREPDASGDGAAAAHDTAAPPPDGKAADGKAADVMAQAGPPAGGVERGREQGREHSRAAAAVAASPTLPELYTRVMPREGEEAEAAAAARRVEALAAAVAQQCELHAAEQPADGAGSSLAEAQARQQQQQQQQQLRRATEALRTPVAAALRRPHPSFAPSLERLRAALQELEERLASAAACWADHPPLRPVWTEFVAAAAHTAEFGAALLVLEANISAAGRSRLWGQERAGWWRGKVAGATSVAAVASSLTLLDEVGCGWEALQKALEPPAAGKRAPVPSARLGRGGGRFRPRVCEVEFAASRGSPLPLLEWCSESPDGCQLRAIVAGQLVSLQPQLDGSWKSERLSAAPLVDLHGLTPAEAMGRRVTAWYEEEGAEGEPPRDVPYSGHVIDSSGCQSGKRGLSVRFDYALDEAGAQEELYLGNDDDWLYGLHAMKPERGSA